MHATEGIPWMQFDRKVNSQLLLNRVSYRKSLGQGNPVLAMAARR